MKTAVWMLRENIRALLTAQHKQQKDLAFAVGKGKSWINKFLNGTREIQFQDLDRIAEFFHLATYQLFLPGIAHETERRKGKDRRTGKDRRMSEELQTMIKIRPLIEKAQRGLSHAPTSDNGDSPSRLTAITNQLQRLSAEAATLLSNSDAGRQTATSRSAVPAVPARRRTRRRPNAEGPCD